MQRNECGDPLSLFWSRSLELLNQLRSENEETIRAAARAISGALNSGGRLRGFGCGHSGLISQDSYYRAGGLREYQHIFCPPVELAQDPVAQSSVEEKRGGWIEEHLDGLDWQQTDTLIVISTSGVNAVPVDAALFAKKQGALVVAITSRSASSALPPRHASGRRLCDVADYVLDNLSPLGDVLVPQGDGEAMGSASTAAGTLLLQALMVAIQQESQKMGSPRRTYVSGNVPGGMRKNAE